MGEYKPEPVEAPHWCTWSGDQIPPSHWPSQTKPIGWQNVLEGAHRRGYKRQPGKAICLQAAHSILHLQRNNTFYIQRQSSCSPRAVCPQSETDHQAENNCKQKQRSFQQKTQQDQHLGVGTDCTVCSVLYPTCFRECWDRLFCVQSVCPSLCCVRSQRGSPRDPRRVQEARECWNRGSTQPKLSLQETVEASTSPREKSQERRLNTAKAQSTRDCGSINISKSQERRLYTANSSSLQETVGAEASPREVSVKKEDSTQQPKLSLQETAEE